MESAGLSSQRPNKRETRGSNMPPPRNMQSRDDGWNSARDLVTVSLEFQVKPLSARVRVQAEGEGVETPSGGSCVSPRGKIQRLIAPSQQIYSFPLSISSTKLLSSLRENLPRSARGFRNSPSLGSGPRNRQNPVPDPDRRRVREGEGGGGRGRGEGRRDAPVRNSR